MDKEDLFKKFFNNDCSKEELKEVYALLKQEVPKEFEEEIFDTLQEVQDDSQTQLLNTNKLKSNILKQIQNDQTLKQQETKIKSIVAHKRVWYAAASVLLLISLGYLTLLGIQQWVNQNTELVWQEVQTKPGERQSIQLSDGTKVTLNGNSKFRYPKEFEKSLREVFLIGEGFFEVVRDTHQPFVVRTGEATTMVLGTKFNVKKFAEDSTYKVSLVEGSVEVSLKNQEMMDEPKILKPKQEFVWETTSQKVKVQEFDPYEVIGWKDNFFIFKKISLYEVAKKLESHFDVKIQFADDNLKNYLIRGKYTGASAEIILRKIFQASKDCFQLNKKDNQIMIQKGDCI